MRWIGYATVFVPGWSAAAGTKSSACQQAVRRLRDQYGLAATALSATASVNDRRWAKCLQLSHGGYVKFLRLFGHDFEEKHCLRVMDVFRGSILSSDSTQTEEELYTLMKSRMDTLGNRKLEVTAAKVAMARQIASKARFDGVGQEVASLVRNEEGHWKVVKHYVKMFFGDDLVENEARLTNDMKSYRLDSSALGLRELRKRYPHEGFNLFVNVVDAKFHPNSDGEAVPCFLVNYLGSADLRELHSLKEYSKRDILIYLTRAIENAQDANRPHKYRLHDALIAAGSQDVASAVGEYAETDFLMELSRMREDKYNRWPFAVAKAAILETSWILGNAKELKDVLHMCGISFRIKSSHLCEHVATSFIRKTTPLWTLNYSHANSGIDKYMEIVRAMSVAIITRFPPLWGHYRVAWEFRMLKDRLDL